MGRPPFRRVLVANRGEIAVRIIRACRDLGMEVVAVYSDADAAGAARAAGRRAVRLGPSSPPESYLRIDAVVAAARRDRRRGRSIRGTGSSPSGRRSPGPSRTRALVYVGPSPATIEALGDKLHARRLAARVGVPAVPGTLDPAPVDRPDQVADDRRRGGARRLPAPGQGGRGRGRARHAPRRARARTCPAALAAGSHEASSAFGDGSVYLEREIAPGAARRGPAARRQPRQRRRAGRARLLAPAPAPEARRGVARAGAVDGPAARPARDGGPARRRRRAAQRGDVRVPARPRRGVLVPRGQHAAPGGARRDGARRRCRHRARAVPRRRGRAARRRRGRRGRARRDADRARDRGPHRRRGSVARVRADARSRRSVGHAVRAGYPRRHGDRGGRCRPARLRQPHRASSWSTATTATPRVDALGARARRDRDRRGPDDAAVPSLRRAQRLVPPRRRCPPAGSTPTGTARRATRRRRGMRCSQPAWPRRGDEARVTPRLPPAMRDCHPPTRPATAGAARPATRHRPMAALTRRPSRRVAAHAHRPRPARGHEPDGQRARAHGSVSLRKDSCSSTASRLTRCSVTRATAATSSRTGPRPFRSTLEPPARDGRGIRPPGGHRRRVHVRGRGRVGATGRAARAGDPRPAGPRPEGRTRSGRSSRARSCRWRWGGRRGRGRAAAPGRRGDEDAERAAGAAGWHHRAAGGCAGRQHRGRRPAPGDQVSERRSG